MSRSMSSMTRGRIANRARDVPRLMREVRCLARHVADVELHGRDLEREVAEPMRDAANVELHAGGVERRARDLMRDATGLAHEVKSLAIDVSGVGARTLAAPRRPPQPGLIP
ncbi:hypothetical protein [Lysobacter sp. HA35]